MNDTISRKAAIHALTEMYCKSDEDGYVWIIRGDACFRIDALPSTERVGKWINEEENSAPICSECKSRALLNYESDYHKSDYCPHCGAKMEK